MTCVKIIVVSVIVASVIPGTCLSACAADVPFDSPGFLPNDTHYSPWVYPLKYLQACPATHNYVWTMYCVNVNYYAYIDPNGGIVSRRDSRVSMDQDVTQYAFHLMDTASSLPNISVLYAVGDWGPSRLRGLLPRNGQAALIVKGRVGGKWTGLKSHAKVFQADNGSDLYVTVHGSVNLQTVELTCKANNALRFVEDSPRLYSNFTGLSRAVERDDGSRNFPDGHGTRSSSGTDLPPVGIGPYRVKFYAGRGNEFVGGNARTEAEAWPNYLNPPMAKQHAPGIVSWYDQILFDAARQLRQGRDVHLDIAIFEIAGESSFLKNLWRFVQNGFESLRPEEKSSAVSVPHRYMGNLTVRLLWQYVDGKCETDSPAGMALHKKSTITKIDRGTGSRYSLTARQIWPAKGEKGPTTPEDMHNKLAIMEVVGYETERRLYVASSNFDQAGKGSGLLWQVGTVIEANPETEAWSGANKDGPSLWNAYEKYYENLWASRQGGPNEGQVKFYRTMAAQHLQGGVNWIETVPQGAFDKAVAPRPGIDAFFFPIPLAAR